MNESNPITDITLVALSHIDHPNDDPSFYLIPTSKVLDFLYLSFAEYLYGLPDDTFPDLETDELISYIESNSPFYINLYDAPLVLYPRTAIIDSALLTLKDIT